MQRNTWLGIAVFGLFGVASEASAQQPGYPTGSAKCRSRETLEAALKNGAVTVQSFCRAKDRDGYRWVADQYGGFWDPLVQRGGFIFTKGHAEGGRWTEVGAGWIAEKPGSIWIEGHYKSDGSWSSGYWEKGRAGQEWMDGFWKDNRWQDGFWRPIPDDSYCSATQTYTDSISLAKLYVPEFCRDTTRAGYSWNGDPYGGYWEPVSVKAGQVFVRGHADGDLGNWVGESWEAEQPGKFFIQGHYDGSGKWSSGKWEPVKRGYTWTDGQWGKDGSWTAGSWSYDPSKACGNGILEEEIRFPKLFVPRYCHDNSRPGYTWNDSQYGGFWEPTAKKAGQVFIRGHINGEFGDFEGESFEAEQVGKFFVQGHYGQKGEWVAGTWNEIKKGYRWEDGSWGSDGSWTAGKYIFDPASQCNAKQTYVEEIKLAKLYVPRFCRETSRAGWNWVNDTYGGHWQPNAVKPNQVFGYGHVDAEFGVWVGESISAPRVGYAFEQGHYDGTGAWFKGDWQAVAPGYKWTPGKYSSDGSWSAGVSVEDPSWTPACVKGQVLVSAIKLSKLAVPPFCREGKRKDFKWVDNAFGGWWAPDVKGYSTGTKVFEHGHYDAKQGGWVGENWLETKADNFFEQGHYGPKGEWVAGRFESIKAGEGWEEGHFEADGNWIKGKAVKGKGGGYGGGKGSGGGGY